MGGGTGGATVAAQLCRRLRRPDVAVIEPSETHEYQPLWTLVGGGVVPKERSRHHEIDVLPRKATWIRQAVASFAPSENAVTLDDDSRVTYDYLVVAVGIQLNWDRIKGMSVEQLGRDGVCSNYRYDSCEGTWRTLQQFTGGTALFTNPPPPIKCAGAPQKIMYLADDHFRRRGVRDRARVIYASGTPGIFSVKEFAATLNKVIERKGIETMYKCNLVEIKPSEHRAIFQSLESEERTEVEYAMIHITPPQGPPDVIRSSPLANDAGWVNVDKATLQSPDYPNVFSLGDASSLPTSKTGAAIRKEAPVLVHNLMATMAGRPPSEFKHYDGYASCPLVTGYGRLVLAEFDYELKPAPSFPFDTTKERWSMYQLKRYGLPAMYWHAMVKGLDWPPRLPGKARLSGARPSAA
ncbi:MAG TPA: FAD/NAD(P)-binding oxidoreductase [Solirubrobacteraceae bacterium]|nr:FAD/NAD(P)-binding oxidoreductase [Solirubrobacteraceae bacterium]